MVGMIGIYISVFLPECHVFVKNFQFDDDILNMASVSTLQFLNIFLDFFHLSLIILMLFGWLIPRLRKIHLIVALLIGFTWLIFLQSKGIGYCIITDWHWQVLTRLGKTNIPETYSQYLIERLTGLTIRKTTAQSITLCCWSCSLILSSVILFRNYIFERKLKETE
jgi:hypothetical protein